MHEGHRSKVMDENENDHNPCAKAMTLAKGICWQKRGINLKDWSTSTKIKIFLSFRVEYRIHSINIEKKYFDIKVEDTKMIIS